MRVGGDAFCSSISSDAARLRYKPRDGQTVPVFPRGVSHGAAGALHALALAVEAAVGVGRVFVRVGLTFRAAAVLIVAVCIVRRLGAVWPAHASISVPSTEK